MSVTYLYYANLTQANLTGTKRYKSRWFQTTCPDGSKTNTGCSASPAASQAAVDHSVVSPLAAAVVAGKP